MYWYRGRPTEAAAALATARDTPRMALAPSLLLLGGAVQLRSMIRSIRIWSVASMPDQFLFQIAARCPRP